MQRQPGSVLDRQAFSDNITGHAAAAAADETIRMFGNLLKTWLWTLAICAAGCTANDDDVDAGRIAAGKEIYQRACRGCHILTRPANRVGPHLHQLLGREAAAAQGFSYSSALIDSGIVWTEESLDAFLSDPLGFVPGTKMGAGAVQDQQERAALIYYIANAGEDS